MIIVVVVAHAAAPSADADAAAVVLGLLLSSGLVILLLWRLLSSAFKMAQAYLRETLFHWSSKSLLCFLEPKRPLKV